MSDAQTGDISRAPYDGLVNMVNQFIGKEMMILCTSVLFKF